MDSLAHETFSTGVPLMRPLVMEFPGDATVADISDEWMMGRSLLAAPVMQEGETRAVYFPAANWYVFGTNQIIGGNQTIDVTATLDEIPVYVPAGTILPLGPVVQSTADLPGGALSPGTIPRGNCAGIRTARTREKISLNKSTWCSLIQKGRCKRTAP